MKKLKAYWNELSRPKKTLLTLSILIICAILSYIALDCPPLTPMMGFHRGEMTNMIGPSEILAEIDIYPEKVYAYRKLSRLEEKVIVAQSSDFDILYNHKHRSFCAYPKSKRPSLYCASSTMPTLMQRRFEITQSLHLILFDRNELSTRAVIKAKINIAEDGVKPYYVSFRETVRREFSGLFYFSITPEKISDVKALSVLQNACMNNISNDKVTITLELYDKNNNLISTDTILPGSA